MKEIYDRRDILLKLQVILGRFFKPNDEAMEFVNWIEDARA